MSTGDKTRGKLNKKTLGKPLRIIFGRTSFVVLSLLLQIIVLLGAFQWLSDHFFYVYGGFTLLSTVIVIYIINKRQNPSYQMAWLFRFWYFRYSERCSICL